MSHYAVVSLFIFKEDWNAYNPNSPVITNVLSAFVFEKQNSVSTRESLFKVNRTVKGYRERRAQGNIPLHYTNHSAMCWGTAPFLPQAQVGEHRSKTGLASGNLNPQLRLKGLETPRLGLWIRNENNAEQRWKYFLHKVAL